MQFSLRFLLGSIAVLCGALGLLRGGMFSNPLFLFVGLTGLGLAGLMVDWWLNGNPE